MNRIPVQTVWDWQAIHDEIIEIRQRLDIITRVLLDQQPAPKISPVKKEKVARYILQLVANETGVSEKELLGHCRFEHLVLPRQMAISLAQKHSQLGVKKLGLIFNRDHGSVTYSCRRVRDHFETNDAKYIALYQALDAKISERIRPV